ncbi:hypothetical protein CDAR_5041 [Caerostris darwini]|uniref:Uncharacterized protein n=1 Tax=Caerostris darwini TaxID=1538125 RepID=A0AAV4P6G4_9ARAC|nr:hypothetical protein CDAR_5041 [Caerostris darwini]
MLSPVQFLGLLILFVLSQAQRDESAASLGGAKVGFYSRQSGLSGSGLNVVSLGGAPVGAYQRQQSPQQWYRVPRVRIIKQRIVRPFVRVVTVPPAIKPTPKEDYLDLEVEDKKEYLDLEDYLDFYVKMMYCN